MWHNGGIRKQYVFLNSKLLCCHSATLTFKHNMLWTRYTFIRFLRVPFTMPLLIHLPNITRQFNLITKINYIFGSSFYYTRLLWPFSSNGVTGVQRSWIFFCWTKENVHLKKKNVLSLKIQPGGDLQIVNNLNNHLTTHTGRFARAKSLAQVINHAIHTPQYSPLFPLCLSNTQRTTLHAVGRIAMRF